MKTEGGQPGHLVWAAISGLPTMYSTIGEAITATHDRLQCRDCLRTQPLTAADAAFYTRRGWPRCHGREMQLLAKEEPTHE
jgi:hypothetical protein